MKPSKFFVHFKNSKGQSASLILMDILIVMASSFLSIMIRFDFDFAGIEAAFWSNLMAYFPIEIVCNLLIFTFFRMYSSAWKYAGTVEFGNIMLACGCASAMQIIGMTALQLYIPRSYFVLYFMIHGTLTMTLRFSRRLTRTFRLMTGKGSEEEPIRTMVVGAGSAGNIIVREAKESKYVNREICCIIDDDPRKKGVFLCGVPIVGSREMIPETVKKYRIEEIFIAIPSLTGMEQKKILDICKQTDCKLSIMPGLYQLINKEVNISTLREVKIDDLLGRDPISVDLTSIMEYVKDQTVVVTGGGGSIGSELCRQIAKYRPRKLIIIDNYENNAYELQMELQRGVPDLDLEVLIASVQNEHRIQEIFCRYRPNLVYHAAAHKHVPLMEESPCEAIKNNVVGTYNVACAANLVHAKRMVMISTDKAVRPTNIMGASKRICEMIVEYFDRNSETEYVAVRFGNVLGSNGSVIPLFKKQIEEGGPVTVTDPRIIRYFMTIPEAVSLVLQAGAYAKGGEIFVLDMGQPVKIADLAENLIRLSGKKPNEDIEIRYVGLRPGEKLYEELLIDETNIQKTENNRIFIGQPLGIDDRFLMEKFQYLKKMAYEDQPGIREMVQELVPEYQIPEDKKEAQQKVV